MAYSVPRLPTLFSKQLSPPKYGALQNNNKRREPPTFSHGNLIPRYRVQQVSKHSGYLKWEIGSSSTDEMCLQESGVNFESSSAMSQTVIEEEKRGIDEMESNVKKSETLMLSVSIVPLPYLVLAALPGAATVRSVFGPFAELVRTWSLPDWLVHWGHPGNMAVVLFAMGGYGSYLGWQIRLSNDVEVKAKAKDLHPKLLGGMFFFFALGATGGITSLLTQDKPIFESPHAATGLIGLTLLTIQTILPALFEGNPNLRNVHGFLGSGIMLLFFIHAFLGLQLGLSI